MFSFGTLLVVILFKFVFVRAGTVTGSSSDTINTWPACHKLEVFVVECDT
jgi:hypothetical protein